MISLIPASVWWRQPSRLNPPQPVNPIEDAIETAKALQLVDLYGCRMYRIAGAEPWIFVKHPAGQVDHTAGDRQHMFKQHAHTIVNQAALLPSIERTVTMQDLLQELSIDRGSDIALGDFLDECSGSRTMRMLDPGRIHENIRVHQN